MGRRNCIYMLEVEYPDEWLDCGWYPTHDADGYPLDEDMIDRIIERHCQDGYFNWPRANRRYFDKSMAYKRANLLETFGARVRVLRAPIGDWEPDDGPWNDHRDSDKFEAEVRRIAVKVAEISLENA